MPAKHEHLARSKQNLQFAQSFDLVTTPYIDWVVTAYFYAALHLVDAFLDHEGRNIHPPNHKERDTYVRDMWELRAIKRAYRDLKGNSENARYQIATFTSVSVEREVIKQYRDVEQQVAELLRETSPGRGIDPPGK